MTDATFVAKKAIAATIANKGEIIPGWINKLSVLSAPLLPELVIKILYTRFGLVSKFKKILDK